MRSRMRVAAARAAAIDLTSPVKSRLREVGDDALETSSRHMGVVML